MYNFEQSAGNQRIEKSIQVGTSETKRGPRNMFTRRYSPWNKNSLIHLYNNNFHFYKNIICSYSTSNVNKEDKTKDLNPLVVYDNFKENRLDILKEQKDK